MFIIDVNSMGCPKCQQAKLEIIYSDNDLDYKITCPNCKTEFTAYKPCDFLGKWQVEEYSRHCIERNEIFELTQYGTRAYYKNA